MPTANVQFTIILIDLCILAINAIYTQQNIQKIFLRAKYTIHHHHHHNHHHVAIKELSHLLARSALTHPEVSSVVFPGSFCLSGVYFL
jgi:hypothetical protein